MKTILTWMILASAIAASAEMLKNPDENTLWRENGKAIKTAEKPAPFIWQQKKLSFTPDEKGFLVEGSGDTGIYTPISQNAPWLCLDVLSAEPTGKGYYGLCINPNLKIGVFGVVSRIPTGIYCVPLGNLPEKERLNYMRLDLSTAKILFRSIEMVKTPPCAVSVEPASVGKGDTVKMNFKLREKADSLEVKFYQTYTMPSLSPDDANRHMAEPVEGSDGKEWTFSFQYNGFKGMHGNPAQGFKPGEILIEAVVENSEEVFSVLNFSPASFQ